MKLIEVTVLVAVPDDADTEVVREHVGGAVAEMPIRYDTTLLDVSVTSERDGISEEEVQEMVAC